MSMARGSLGPFPKTRRWSDLVAEAHAGADQVNVRELSDLSIANRLAVLLRLGRDPIAVDATIAWAALPLVTRTENPSEAFDSRYQLEINEDLEKSILSLGPADHPVVSAAAKTVIQIAGAEDGLIPTNHWEVWRSFDGPDFCNLAHRFYSNLNWELLRPIFSQASADHVERLAREMAIITRAFSARWFNACARFEIPSRNNVRWYLGHCLGKLELEYSRELSTWTEQPRKRRGIPQPSLDI